MGKCEMVAAPEPHEEDEEVREYNMLTREAILGVEDVTTEVVDVPEWGGSVFVRVMSAGERDNFEESSVNRDGTPNLVNYRARFAAMVICDHEGTPQFTPEDVSALALKNANALDRILEAGLRVNALAKDSIEALEKN